MKTKSILSILMVLIMLFALVGCSAGAGSASQSAPQLRINQETNEWEISYNGGTLWESMGVKATGERGADGKDGADAVAPRLQINTKTNYWEVSYDNGVTWESLHVKAIGADGKDGENGTNGTDGKNGVNGINGTDGVTPRLGEDGYWYIGDKNTGIYAGTTETVTVTFKELFGDNTITVTKGSLVNYYVPTNPVATFINWYTDEACTQAFDFNKKITANTTVYSAWEYDETFATVANLTVNTNFGNASCFGTNACFGSVYVRVLADDHGYYNGASGIANYLKGVFVEDENGNVSVSSSSGLRRISYTDALCVINFSSAFSSYQEYVIRNGLTMDADIAAQKELAIKYFETVDYTAEGYNKATGGGGLSFPSMAVAVVALGNLMEQQDTQRYDTLIKAAYENVDAAFYNSGMYLNPFYQLCSKYEWFTGMPDMSTETELTTSDVLNYYAYGIDLANDYAELWNAFVESALADNALSASEAKAFAYHYAYQLTAGDVYLGVYGNSRSIVDYSVVTG